MVFEDPLCPHLNFQCVNDQLNEKQILCFQCYRNKITQNRSSYSKFLFFLEQGDLFVGFGPQIQYQFAFAKTTDSWHPPIQNLLEYPALGNFSLNKRTFKIRGYNNQTSWTKNSNDMGGFEREAR